MKRHIQGCLVVLVGLLAACSDGRSVVGGPADTGSSDLGPLDVGFAVDVPDVPPVTVDAGFIRANGQIGQNEFNVLGCGSGGGGGGAGGAVYLRASAASLGAGLITASGGVGGDDPSNCGRPGGVGSVGRVTLRGSSTTTGTTAPAFTAAP